jgi:multisubunit Na+/H+ antiporter MnhG subunit
LPLHYGHRFNFSRSDKLSLCVAAAFCNIACVILVVLSVLMFISGTTTHGIVFLILAFLLSPFGIPAIAEWLVDKLNDLKENLKDFITG